MIKPKIDGDLLIYNWAQYMDPDLKKGFSDKYGVDVNEVNFDNLEAMVDQARAGAHYDLIWPSTEYVDRLNEEGLLATLRPRPASATRTGSRSYYDNPWWDPNDELSVPYTYYTTGIAWRNDEVSRDDRLLERPDEPRRRPGGCSSSTTSRRRSARRT